MEPTGKGTVSAVWHYPFKSMRGEELEAAEITDRGLLGDRVYAMIDVETGRVVSQESPEVGESLRSSRHSWSRHRVPVRCRRPRSHSPTG